MAFTGNDGSGKTTLAKGFEEKLRNLGLAVEYRQEFNYFLLCCLFRLLGKEKVSSSRRLFLTKESGVRKPAYFKAWPYLVWVDLFLEWLWNKLFKRNSVIVMDRYAYDFLMSWEWLGYTGVCLRWLYTHFPKPDLAFILDVSPQTAYQRKRYTHAYSLHYYELQRERYLTFAKTLVMKIIDTEKAANECLREVLTEFRRHFIDKLSNEDKVLVFYSFPDFDPSILQELNLSFDWSDLNWGYIIDMAVKCSTENLLCRNLLRHHGNQFPRRVSELLRHVLEKSIERVGLLVRTLGVVSRKLGRKKVPFVVMKTIAPFDYGATDIDIIVRREDFERAQEALSLIFKASKRSRMHKAITYEGVLLPIDLHYEVSWLGNKVVDEEEVFARKRKIIYNEVEFFVPSPEDELLILSAHSLFQHHYTTLGEFLQIVGLASKKEVDVQYVLNHSARYGWEGAFGSLLSDLAWKYNLIFGGYSGFQEGASRKRFLELDINLVYFHNFHAIPKNLAQAFELLMTPYRRVRFKISRRLAYNDNWLDARAPTGFLFFKSSKS